MTDQELQQETIVVELEEESRDWRTEVPNIVLRVLRLDPFALDLYIHLRSIAGGGGGGKAEIGGRKLAELTGMSRGQVADVKKRLSQPFQELGGKPLIRLGEKVKSQGGMVDSITITNIWRENSAYLNKLQKGKSGHVVA